MKLVIILFLLGASANATTLDCKGSFRKGVKISASGTLTSDSHIKSFKGFTWQNDKSQFLFAVSETDGSFAKNKDSMVFTSGDMTFNGVQVSLPSKISSHYGESVKVTAKLANDGAPASEANLICSVKP